MFINKFLWVTSSHLWVVLPQLLNICHDYCELHDLTFNAKKTMCMYFSIDINKHCGLPVIYLGTSVCQFVKEVK